MGGGHFNFRVIFCYRGGRAKTDSVGSIAVLSGFGNGLAASVANGSFFFCICLRAGMGYTMESFING